mgnify:CR=1 FL=1
MANHRKFLYVTLPDGKVENRKTDAAYTHVVALLIRYADGSEHWTALQWSKSEANAVKATKSAWWAKNLGREDRGQTWLEFRVVPVDKKEDISGDIVNPSTQDDFDTGLVYDQPAPKYVFPLVIDTASWERMVDAELAHQDAEKMHAVLSGVFETGLMYDQPQEEPLRFKIGEMAIDNFGNLVTISKIKTDGPYPLYGFGNDHWCHADWLTRIDPLNTGMLYDQPQPFTFDFKRGDVVEFLFAFPRTPAHKGWLKGVFYNVYPGDKRYACIRREGIYEAALLADIRKPRLVDIFDGMGDFNVKAPDSAKAA